MAIQIELKLTVAEQRAWVEKDCGEPCFRMWLSKAEYVKAGEFADWTAWILSDGRIAVWRKKSDLYKAPSVIQAAIMRRIISDDSVT